MSLSASTSSPPIQCSYQTAFSSLLHSNQHSKQHLQQLPSQEDDSSPFRFNYPVSKPRVFMLANTSKLCEHHSKDYRNNAQDCNKEGLHTTANVDGTLEYTYLRPKQICTLATHTLIDQDHWTCLACAQNSKSNPYTLELHCVRCFAQRPRKTQHTPHLYAESWDSHLR
jgi:hypothetical protein